MYFGRLFHVIWNAVPVELEPCSNLAGTGVQLSCNKAGAKKLTPSAYGVRSERWRLEVGRVSWWR